MFDTNASHIQSSVYPVGTKEYHTFWDMVMHLANQLNVDTAMFLLEQYHARGEITDDMFDNLCKHITGPLTVMWEPITPTPMEFDSANADRPFSLGSPIWSGLRTGFARSAPTSLGGTPGVARFHGLLDFMSAFTTAPTGTAGVPGTSAPRTGRDDKGMIVIHTEEEKKYGLAPSRTKDYSMPDLAESITAKWLGEAPTYPTPLSNERKRELNKRNARLTKLISYCANPRSMAKETIHCEAELSIFVAFVKLRHEMGELTAQQQVALSYKVTHDFYKRYFKEMSAYSIWVKLLDNQGKTEDDYLNELAKTFAGTEVVTQPEPGVSEVKHTPIQDPHAVPGFLDIHSHQGKACEEAAAHFGDSSMARDEMFQSQLLDLRKQLIGGKVQSADKPTDIVGKPVYVTSAFSELLSSLITSLAEDPKPTDPQVSHSQGYALYNPQTQCGLAFHPMPTNPGQEELYLANLARGMYGARPDMTNVGFAKELQALLNKEPRYWTPANTAPKDTVPKHAMRAEQATAYIRGRLASGEYAGAPGSVFLNDIHRAVVAGVGKVAVKELSEQYFKDYTKEEVALFTRINHTQLTQLGEMLAASTI